MPPATFSDETGGDQKPLIEALVQALNRFVDRFKQIDPRVKSEPENKT
jgi:hypothetical protein